VKVYPCSKSRHAPFWAALRAAGVNIAASWPWWERNADGLEPSTIEWCDHSARCISEAADADILLLYAREDEQQFGALLECGSALGAGKQVYLVADRPWPFLRNHPRVRSFRTLEDAIAAIMAACASEASRLSQLSTATGNPQAPATIHKVKP
jgi:hypothetical protein